MKSLKERGWFILPHSSRVQYIKVGSPGDKE